ncbi:ABC transporter permease [Allocoleopsis sp.]|uniref:ABC transporter permease n=1 Tax=Allocoleopsis sp. TaxID=3088169 RepID=UPI002FCF8A18
MNRAIRKAQAFLSVYYAHMLEYRAELLLWALSGTLPLILLGVWTKASQNGQFGLEPADFARYFLAVFLVRQFNVVWVVWEFEKEVVQGRLSPRLLQPIDPAWHHVAMHLSERLARLPFVVVLVGLFFLLYPQAIWLPSLGRVLLFVPVVALAFTVRFLMQYTFALLAFWTERASAIEQFSFLFYLFLSGMIAPLEVFPPAVREVAQWTPFPYLIHFPAAILIGLPVDIVRSILVMLGWSLLFFILNRWLWRKGLKQYSGMGA